MNWYGETLSKRGLTEKKEPEDSKDLSSCSAIVARLHAVQNLSHHLFEPDLIVFERVQNSPFFWDQTVKSYFYYHWEYGMSFYSRESFDEYVVELLGLQAKKRMLGYGFRIGQVVLCCYNVFSMCDVRIEVRIGEEGGIEEMVVSSVGRGGNIEVIDIDGDMWEELFISSNLRYIFRDEFSVNILPIYFNSMDDFSQDVRDTFFSIVEKYMTHFDYLIGSTKTNLIGHVVHNYVTEGIIKYFKDRGLYNELIDFLSKMSHEVPEFHAIQSKIFRKLHMKDMQEQSLKNGIDLCPKNSDSILIEQIETFLGDSELENAFEVAQTFYSEYQDSSLSWYYLALIHAKRKEYFECFSVLNVLAEERITSPTNGNLNTKFSYETKSSYKQVEQAKILEDREFQREDSRCYANLHQPRRTTKAKQIYKILYVIYENEGLTYLTNMREQYFEAYSFVDSLNLPKSPIEIENDNSSDTDSISIVMESDEDTKIDLRVSQKFVSISKPLEEGFEWIFSDFRTLQFWESAEYSSQGADEFIYSFNSESGIPEITVGAEYTKLGMIAYRLKNYQKAKTYWLLCDGDFWCLKGWVCLYKLYVKEDDIELALRKLHDITQFYKSKYGIFKMNEELRKYLLRLVSNHTSQELAQIYRTLKLSEDIIAAEIREILEEE